jgi:hypothetical protein
MRRYLLFGGDTYYPIGGWDDYQGSYNDIYEAADAAEKARAWDWYHIVDSTDGQIVKSAG